MKSAIVVSPHLDDAALSCGGGITRLVRAGIPVTVVTMFTADQPQGVPLSPLARHALVTWGPSEHLFADRRAEDRAAMSLLGVRFEHLDQLDVVFRRSRAGAPLYQGPMASPAPDDVEDLLPRLVAALRSSAVGTASEATVFCPIAACGHVDHTLTRRAVEQVIGSTHLIYYGEYPYYARPDAPGAGVIGPDGWRLHELPLSADEIEGRVAAIACYKSQLRGLFPSPMERFGTILAQRVPAIGHIWVPKPDLDASRKRMTAKVIIDTAGIGGERYLWSPESTAPFLAALQGRGLDSGDA